MFIHFMVWWTNYEEQSKLHKVVNVSSKTVGKRFCCLSELYERRVVATTMKSIGKTSHILASQYEILQSKKCYGVPLLKTVRGKLSFIPTTVKLLNKHY